MTNKCGDYVSDNSHMTLNIAITHNATCTCADKYTDQYPLRWGCVSAEGCLFLLCTNMPYRLVTFLIPEKGKTLQDMVN